MMVTSTGVVTNILVPSNISSAGTLLHKGRDQSAVLGDLIKIIELEYNKGNRTVTQEKYQAFLKLQKLQELQKQQRQKLEAKSTPALPAPLYPSIFLKFKPPQKTPPQEKRTRTRVRRSNTPWSLKQIEASLITILETFANLLDNLHLLSKMPIFPKSLVHLLNHTNRIWVLILVFLIRKTISQLLNVRRKERKIASELSILKSNTNSKLLEHAPAHNDENNIFRKYEKVLRDLKFDKTMLKIELLGNLLDLAFNLIELYDVPVPSWFMGMLNFASIAMTVYRMNKDDEYIDDDISEDVL